MVKSVITNCFNLSVAFNGHSLLVREDFKNGVYYYHYYYFIIYHMTNFPVMVVIAVPVSVTLSGST